MSSTQNTSMLPHIFHPIPSLDSVPEPANREQRLEIIISNLDKQHAAVRQRILASAKSELEIRRSQQSSTSPISPITSPASNPTPLQDPSIQHLIASLQTPRSPAPAEPQSAVAQVETPPEVELALRTLDQLEDYDANIAKTRDYYTRALARAKGMPVESPVEPMQRGSVDAARDPRLARRQSMPAAPEPQRRASGVGMGSGEVDASRDPRRRG